jgi:hypothetical protein
VSRLPGAKGWRLRILQLYLVLLALSIGFQLTAKLLAPIVPTFLVLAVIVAIGWFVFDRRR